MAIRFLWLLFLATSIPLATAQTAAAPAAAAKGPIRIAIKNEYVADVNFGPLGSAYRDGKDTANGELEWNEEKKSYIGSVKAKIDSHQKIEGLMGDCPRSHYDQSQELTVIGMPVNGFNSESQTVVYNRATSTGRESGKFLLLSFTPKSDIPQPARDDNGQLIVACHTLIERPRGFPFMPFNDSRWTTDQSGYVIALPVDGVLKYTDTTVAEGGVVGSAYSPVLNISKSIWTVEVERLP